MLLEFAEIVKGEGVQGIHISEIRTISDAVFFCPYCHAELEPILSAGTPHFDHQQKPCRYVRRYEEEPHINLPLYRDFRPSSLSELAGIEWETLEGIEKGELPLVDFYDLQQPLVKQVFHRFQQQLDAPKNERERRYFLCDLKLFEWTRRKCERFALYLFKLPDSSACYHLSSFGQSQYTYPKILQTALQLPQPPELLARVPRRAGSEWYIAHRFQLQRDGNGVFRLNPEMLDRLLKELHDLRYKNAERRRRVREGIQRAKAGGVALGPPREEREVFLNKPQSRKIARLLRKGLSLREVRRRSGAGINTIRKVKLMLARTDM